MAKKSYICHYLPLEPYLPCREIPVYYTGKYRGGIFRPTLDSDDSEDNEVDCVCSNCKHPPKEGGELKRCSHCHIPHYCSVQCQRKDWDFHRFACSVVAKKVNSNA